MAHYLYIIQSLADGSYYVGSTQDVDNRVERHNQGRSQYTKSKRPWQLVHFEECSNKSDAIKRENQIKKRKSKKYMDSLIAASSQA